MKAAQVALPGDKGSPQMRPCNTNCNGTQHAAVDRIHDADSAFSAAAKTQAGYRENLPANNSTERGNMLRGDGDSCVDQSEAVQDTCDRSNADVSYYHHNGNGNGNGDGDGDGMHRENGTCPSSICTDEYGNKDMAISGQLDAGKHNDDTHSGHAHSLENTTPDVKNEHNDSDPENDVHKTSRQTDNVLLRDSDPSQEDAAASVHEIKDDAPIGTQRKHDRDHDHEQGVHALAAADQTNQMNVCGEDSVHKRQLPDDKDANGFVPANGQILNGQNSSGVGQNKDESTCSLTTEDRQHVGRTGSCCELVSHVCMYVCICICICICICMF